MTEAEQARFVTVASEYAQSNGYEVADCCDLFEHHDGTVVVHLKKPVQEVVVGGRIVAIVESNLTVCVMIDRHTGKCWIPESL